MKFIHLSDLHLGMRLGGYSLHEDQQYILGEILRITEDESPDAVLIAGDIYDKSVPPAEAVQLFDDFLTRLSAKGIPTFVISGNHDSPERIAFGARMMRLGGIYLSPVYGGTVTPVSLTDEYGTVDVFLLPFVKPAHVRRFAGEKADEITTYSEAVQAAVDAMERTPGRRCVLVTHQFVTGALRSDSEILSVGGTDNVDVSVFDSFDYVALGHIHSPQNCGSPHVRYCGTPLKYSFSEAGDEKSVTVAELCEKGSLTVRTVPLTPLRDMREIRGTYGELMRRSFYENTSYPQDYLRITLTDEEDVPDAVGKLRCVYHNLMKLDYDNARTRTQTTIEGAQEPQARSPLQIFAEFYELQNNQPLSDKQTEFLKEHIDRIWEEQR